MDRRPIVVNSLLCFIHNYRDSILTNDLKTIVHNYFSKSVVSVAYSTLIELLPQQNATMTDDTNCVESSNDGNISSSLISSPPTDIIHLYDYVAKNSQSPVIFVTADLSELPLTLITDELDSSSEILREIRQLKLFIQDALSGKIEHTRKSSVNGTDEFFTTARSLESKMNPISSSSDTTPTVSTVVSSSCFTPTTSSSFPPINPLALYPKANNHFEKKKNVGYRLDAMVKKLTENKRKERETIQMLGTPIWPTAQMVNTVAYINMIRSMTSMTAAAAAAAQSSMFPSTALPQPDNLPCNHDLSMEIDIKNEETSADQEKNIDELRSPSPSESVNNTDLVYSCNDLTNADKPYTCMHTNCHKRFANKFLLKKHQFIHTGLRPHRCPFCGKRFNRKDNLLRHKKTHIANALAPDINELSGEDFLLQMNSDKPLLQLNNEADQEEDL